MKTLPTSDEKMIAAMVHGSVLLSFLGPIAPTLLWSSQRLKSTYVRFHALQAMGYQIIFFWFWLIAAFGIVFLSIVLIVPITIFVNQTSADASFAPFLIQPIIFIGIFSVFGLYFLLGFIGALFCFIGREFRYPLLGKWLEKYLSYGADSDIEINEVQEHNWVGGMCHATAILQLWGIVLPLVVWVTQKEKASQLRFQALQSIVYQGAAFIAYLLGMAVYMFFFFGMFFVLIAGGMLGGGQEISGPLGVVFLVTFLIIILFGLLTTLLGPIYLIIAFIAAARVIRGNDYRYPILGRFLEHRMKASNG